MAAGINERTWLQWLVKVRVIIITILLVIELAIVNITVTNVSRPLFLLVIFGWYASAAVYLYLMVAAERAGATDSEALHSQGLRSGALPSWALQSKLQVITDLIFTTAVIYVTGGIDTTFVFLYPILIIVASTLLSETWAYLTAGLSFVLFGSILELSYFDLIHSYSVNRPDLKTMQAVIAIYLVAFAAIAYLGNKLVRRMRRAEGELEDKSFELENLQVLHQIIVRSISSGLIITDLEGAIRLVNPAAQAILGCGPADLTGQSVHELFLDPLPFSGQSRKEVRARNSRGAEILLGIGGSLLLATDGAIIGNIYTFTDLTHMRNLERELRQRDRLAAVGRMASGIAHEIRNPLSSIAGSAQMLSGIASLSDDQRALLSIVTRESERLNAIIDDFLAYSRDRDVQSARVDLCQLLSDTLTLLENLPSGIRIERRCNLHEAFIEGDGDKLKQVFWNLCSNAVRAMPQGGTLTVSLDQQDGNWLVRFQDTGTGIPPHLLEKVFEPFQSGFEGGTGVGPATVYRIM
jgi:two-component system, NtrC family, sensor histidine kinase PilS